MWVVGHKLIFYDCCCSICREVQTASTDCDGLLQALSVTPGKIVEGASWIGTSFLFGRASLLWLVSWVEGWCGPPVLTTAGKGWPFSGNQLTRRGRELARYRTPVPECRPLCEQLGVLWPYVCLLCSVCCRVQGLICWAMRGWLVAFPGTCEVVTLSLLSSILRVVKQSSVSMRRLRPTSTVGWTVV